MNHKNRGVRGWDTKPFVPTRKFAEIEKALPAELKKPLAGEKTPEMYNYAREAIDAYITEGLLRTGGYARLTQLLRHMFASAQNLNNITRARAKMLNVELPSHLSELKSKTAPVSTTWSRPENRRKKTGHFDPGANGVRYGPRSGGRRM